MPPERLLGDPVASEIREAVGDRVLELGGRDVTPTLGTVLMSDDAADGRFMDLKHAACDDAGIATRDRRLSPDAPADELYDAVEELSSDPGVHAVFVQSPLPDHVSETSVRYHVAPEKDADCFHPRNLGRLVVGDPRFVPATPAAVCRLLSAYDVAVDGRDVVIVGRSTVIGRPLANLLLRRESPGNATVTVCHTRTSDLGAVTRRADVLVTAAGVPGLVDGSMLSPGVTVVDVSANRVARAGDAKTTVVGDVDFESASEVADAITPVPGGVGPVTLAMLLQNVVLAAQRQATETTQSGDRRTL